MAARIEVAQIADGEFLVRLIEDAGESSHRVTLRPDDFQQIAGGEVEPLEFVKRSFEFLLEREPKESILAQFDLPVIGRYFPEYEHEMRRRL